MKVKCKFEGCDRNSVCKEHEGTRFGDSWANLMVETLGKTGEENGDSVQASN